MGADWQMVAQVFDAASGRCGAERAGYLDDACGEDVALRAEVESLLAQAERDGDFLERPLSAEAPQVLRSLAGIADGLVGARLGDYVVDQVVASGGMGTVYRAHVHDDPQSEVAVKVVRADVDGQQVADRLRREGEVLARLEHPNIARFIESSTTPDGRPFYVMAFIDGEQILTACDRRRLSIRARLELFCQVCTAVEHAHRNLIVHRDLKPANVLVDAAGEPHLVDFGIAKVLDVAVTGASPSPAATRLMTPEYASPEQARGENATTASDVYSLGMILFELLTGRAPYRFATYSPVEIARVVSEVEVSRPSEFLTEGGGDRELAEIADRRGLSPAQLRRRLADDLDNIVMVALRKEPERRYATVAQLTEDVRRHLRGLPVTARPDTFFYRAAKFARRHRVAVAMSLAVGVALALGVVGVVWQGGVAREEARTAQEVTDLMVEVLGGGDADQRTNLTARQFVDRAAARVAENADLQPAVRATLLDAFGRMYAKLGDYGQSETFLRRSLALRREVLAPDDPDVAETECALAVAQLRLGYPESATQPLQQAIATARAAGNEPLLAKALDALALAKKYGGDRVAAEALFREVLAIRRRICGPNDRAIAATMNSLASVRWNQGDLEETGALLRAARTVHEANGQEDHPGLAQVVNNLGVLSGTQGDHDAAICLLQEALAMRERLFGASHPLVAETLYSLGEVLVDAHRSVDGEVVLRRCLAIREQLLPQHWYTDDTRSMLGHCLIELGRLDEAAPLLAAALAALREKKGDAFDHTQDAIARTIHLYELQGRSSEAEPLRALQAR